MAAASPAGDEVTARRYTEDFLQRCRIVYIVPTAVFIDAAYDPDDVYLGVEIGFTTEGQVSVFWGAKCGEKATLGDVNPKSSYMKGTCIFETHLPEKFVSSINTLWEQAREYLAALDVSDLAHPYKLAAERPPDLNKPGTKLTFTRASVCGEDDNYDTMYQFSESESDDDTQIGEIDAQQVLLEQSESEEDISTHGKVQSARKMKPKRPRLPVNPKKSPKSKAFGYVLSTPAQDSVRSSVSDQQHKPRPKPQRRGQAPPRTIAGICSLFFEHTLEISGLGLPMRFSGPTKTMTFVQWLAECTSEHMADRVSKGELKADQRNAFVYSRVTEAEMRRWLGVYILMGVTDHKKLHHYWDSLHGDEYIQPGEMSRERWKAIHIHIRAYSKIRREQQKSSNAASQEPSPQSLREVKDAGTEHLERAFNTISAAVYHPGSTIVIDEHMTPSKSSFAPPKIRMPNKPVRMGLKTFAACCGKTSYMLRVALYTGDSLWQRLREKGIDGFNNNVSLIRFLAQEWTGSPVLATQPRYVVVDNYFTSPATLQHLLAGKQPIQVLGTLRKDRLGKAVSQFLVDKGIVKGKTSRETPGFAITPTATLPEGVVADHRDSLEDAKAKLDKWPPFSIFCAMDPNPFFVISSVQHLSPLRGRTELYTKLKNGTKQPFSTHEAVKIYRKTYGAVDRADRSLGINDRSTRCKFWTVRFLQTIVNMLVHNARIYMQVSDCLDEAEKIDEKKAMHDFYVNLGLHLLYGGKTRAETNLLWLSALEKHATQRGAKRRRAAAGGAFLHEDVDDAVDDNPAAALNGSFAQEPDSPTEPRADKASARAAEWVGLVTAGIKSPPASFQALHPSVTSWPDSIIVQKATGGQPATATLVFPGTTMRVTCQGFSCQNTAKKSRKRVRRFCLACQYAVCVNCGHECDGDVD